MSNEQIIKDDKEVQDFLSGFSNYREENDEEMVTIEKVIAVITKQEIEKAELIDFLKIMIKGHQKTMDDFIDHMDQSKKKINLDQRLNHSCHIIEENEAIIKKYLKIIELLRDNNKLRSDEQHWDIQRSLDTYLEDLMKSLRAKEDE